MLNREVKSGVHLIHGYSNSFIVEAEDGLVLIDAGFNPQAKSIRRYIREKLPRRKVKAIVITHNHVDHVRGLRCLVKEYSPEVLAHPADSAVIRGEAPYSVRGGLLKPLFWILLRLFDTPKVEVSRELTDGEKYSTLTVIHTPGHTSGHLSFLDEKRSILFTGDAIADRRGRLALPPNIFNQNPSDVKKSALKLAGLEFETLLPSHGEPILSDASQVFRNSPLLKTLN